MNPESTIVCEKKACPYYHASYCNLKVIYINEQGYCSGANPEGRVTHYPSDGGKKLTPQDDI